MMRASLTAHIGSIRGKVQLESKTAYYETSRDMILCSVTQPQPIDNAGLPRKGAAAFHGSWLNTIAELLQAGYRKQMKFWSLRL
jgi:hypothetical protein